ncbi:MAG: P44/Msp2 family outer membrane protein [Cyanobacteria bacterium P01_B01_bin.77]
MRNFTRLFTKSAAAAIFWAGLTAPVLAQSADAEAIDPLGMEAAVAEALGMEADTDEPLGMEALGIESEEIDSDSDLLIAQAVSPGAGENGWYVSLAPNLVFGYPVDIESDEPITITTAPIFPGLPPVTTNIPVDISFDADTGFGVSGAAGYRFDHARVELEVTYTSNDVEGVTVNDLAEIPLDGGIESVQFMVNGYYDIPTKSRFSPYIGGGVGVATLTVDDIEADIPGVGTLALDDTGASFVFQVKAGVGYEISEQASAFLGYRLHGLPGQNFEAFGADLDADTILIHSLQLGARYEF